MSTSRKGRGKKPSAKPNSGGPATSQAGGEQAADLGVLFVHGIGNQKPQSVLDGMARPFVDALVALGHKSGLRSSEQRELDMVEALRQPGRADGPPRSARLTMADQRGRTASVLVAEAVWSESFTRPSLLRNVLWILRCLPAAALLLSFDHRDAALGKAPEPSPAGAAEDATRHRGRRLHRLFHWHIAPSDRAVALSLGRLAWRIAVGAFILLVCVRAALEFPLVVPPVLLALVGYLGLRVNIVGHVVVAASQRSELERMTRRVAECLEWVERRSTTVMVVAHSQGGYLAHQVLAARRGAGKVRVLAGVGSGLKPIWILGQLGRPEVAVSAWLSIIALALGELAVWQFVSADLTHRTLDFLGSFGEPVLALVFPALAMARGNPAEPLESTLALLMEDPFFLRSFAALAWYHWASLALFFAGTLVARRLMKAAYPDGWNGGIQPLEGVSWTEYSTHHDLVGRMLLPELPEGARASTVSVGGNPLLDHVSYFSTSSSLPWELAATALAAVKGTPPDPSIAQVSAGLQAQARRRRLLRHGSMATVVSVLLLAQLVSGRSFRSALAVTSVPVFLYGLFLGTVFRWREVTRNRLALARFRKSIVSGGGAALALPTDSRARFKPVVILFFQSVVTFFAGAALSTYPQPGSGAEVGLVLISTASYAYFLLALAGYHVWWWPLCGVVGLGAALHLTQVRPLPVVGTDLFLLTIPGATVVVMTVVGSALVAWLLRASRMSAHAHLAP